MHDSTALKSEACMTARMPCEHGADGGVGCVGAGFLQLTGTLVHGGSELAKALHDAGEEVQVGTGHAWWSSPSCYAS